MVIQKERLEESSKVSLVLKMLKGKWTLKNLIPGLNPYPKQNQLFFGYHCPVLLSFFKLQSFNLVKLTQLSNSGIHCL